MFEAILRKTANELKKRKIPYMVIGGQAVLLYGEPRFTRDIDITLGVDIDRFEEVKAAVKSLGFNPSAEDPEGFAAKTNVFPVVDVKSGIRIDFIFSYSEYEREAISRGRLINMSGVKIRFISVEDLLIHKIIAGRPRDIEDVKNILIKNSGLDHAYIRKWMKAIGESTVADYAGIYDKMFENNAKAGIVGLKAAVRFTQKKSVKAVISIEDIGRKIATYRKERVKKRRKK